MRIIDQAGSFVPSKKSCSVTIGTFDGLHLGHRSIIEKAKGLAEEVVVLTFSTHPVSFLKNSQPQYLIPLSQRLALLESAGVDTCLLLPFTHEIAEQDAFTFLFNLRCHIPFSHLVLGHDASIGRRREGNQSKLQEIAKKCQFHVEFLSPFLIDDQPVSSTRIRLLIQQGKFLEVSHLLGRPYSITSPIQSGSGKGKLLGFQTANICVDELILPPNGVYIVRAHIGNTNYPAVANLGFAPTLQSRSKPVLEVHILDLEREIYGESIEVEFMRFLRREQKFASSEELKTQIINDIHSTRLLLNSK